MQFNLFDTYCTSNHSLLLSFASKLTRSRTDAEDIVQDVFIKAAKNWKTFRGSHNPEELVRVTRAWLYLMVRNRFTDLCRARARQAGRTSSVEAELYGPSVMDPPQILSGSLRDALGLLSEDQRQIVLRCAAGDTYGEIATALGIPFGSVTSRLYRARQILQTELAGVAAIYGFKPGQKKIRSAPKPTERKKAQATRINRVVVGDDERKLFDVQADSDSVAAW